MDIEKITRGLNPAQKEAVQSLDGPLLILAGAGSGKTRVLIQRMALMIATGKAAPEEILAMTFTNKAAREMESRIFKRLLAELGSSRARESMWISTFHSYLHPHVFGPITLSFWNYQTVLQHLRRQRSVESQIKKVMNSLNISDKDHSAANHYRKPQINTAKMLGLAPREIEKSPKLFLDQKSVEVYKFYEQEMKKANALDFGDLLLKVLDLFNMYPGILEQYQNQFKYIMVDEYQDTNHIQYILVQMLAKKNRNLCVVGDEDQSIYSWRGADIRNILDFEKDFPEAQSG